MLSMLEEDEGPIDPCPPNGMTVSDLFASTATLSVGDDLPLLEVLFWPGPDGECLELIQLTDRSGSLS